MSAATALARARVRSTSTTSRATPRITSAKAHAEPTLPAPMTPTFMTIPLPCARRCPEVDPTFGGVPVDVFQLLGRAVRRPIVVRQVEVRDPQIEGPADDGALRLDQAIAPEVLPEPERDCRELEPAATGAPVGHASVTVLVRRGHSSTTLFRPLLRIPHLE